MGDAWPPDEVSELFDSEIGVAQLTKDVPHLLVDPLHLLEARLVDLLCCHVGRGVELETLSVELLSIWETTAGYTFIKDNTVQLLQDTPLYITVQ